MVSVTHSLGKLEINATVPVAEIVGGLADTDAALVVDAIAFATGLYAGRSLDHGEPVLEHAVGTALILAGLRLDAETRAAGILFDAPNCLPPAATAEAQLIALGKRFGAGIARLVAEVAKVNRLRLITRQHAQAGLAGEQRDEAQIEVLRKMLLAMAEDVRVVLIR